MDDNEGVAFLFTIAKEIKRSFENPVILLTQKDYADCIFSCLVDMRSALLQNASPDQVADIVNTFHLSWLQAVQDIENFKKRAKNTPRDTILRSIDYSTECVKKRHRYFQKYIQQLQCCMTEEENNEMQANIEIIGDMCEIVNYALIEKEKCLRTQADKADFYVIIMNEIEELLNWLDKLNDHLAIELISVIDLKLPLLSCDLVKALQQIIDEVAVSCPSPENLETSKKMLSKTKILGSVGRPSPVIGFDLVKVIDKIKNLEDRINRLKVKETLKLTLEHKTMYLEERLQSLQDLKLSLNCITTQNVRKECSVDDEELHIFNHLLPQPARCRLVENLVKLWRSALNGGVSPKSIISIFSSADLKEIFSDDLGYFSVDKYGRKIYTSDEEDKLYQLNETNELVEVMDDEKHVYFYDECGRYYLNDTQERVYKAHASASEYLLNRTGYMLKVSEVEEGVEFRYDNLGRYYTIEKGVRIYKESGSEDEFIHDGLGNLVRIRTEIPSYTMCPQEPMLLEESIYLKMVVGTALKKCIAEVVLVQPPDPIKYLAVRLEKYRSDIEVRQKQAIDRGEMMAERAERKMEDEPTPPSLVCEPEESTIDCNFREYISTVFET